VWSREFHRPKIFLHSRDRSDRSSTQTPTTYADSFPDGGSITVTSLVPGTYSVYEDTPGDTLTWWKVEGENGVVPVAENQTPTVTITNYGSTTSTTDPWGCLEITKQVTGDIPPAWCGAMETSLSR